MNCCKSVSTWQQLVFVTPGSTSSDHSYCMWLTFKLTNTFQTCVINHLINSYNSPPLGSVVACLLIDLIVHRLLLTDYFYQEVMKPHIYWPKHHRYTANQRPINWQGTRSGIGSCRHKKRSYRGRHSLTVLTGLVFPISNILVIVIESPSFLIDIHITSY